MKLRISPDLALPLEAVTESIGILAVKRAGKSHTAKKIAEQLHAAKQQIVIIDPKGDWWGLRSPADGNGPGLPVPILGGEHGDIPLEAGGGEIAARLAVEDRASLLLDLSEFRKHQVATFMTAFLETFYRLKAKEAYRTPVMLIVDEADAIAPQRPMEGEQRMLGAAEDIVRRGGQRGIGITLVSQRAAILNKNVLTQCGILILLRTTGSQDIDAVNEWIRKHGQEDHRADVMSTIAQLPRGTAWIWAPGWPNDAGIFKQVAISPCETYDSGATPKPGAVRLAPKTMAEVDLAAFSKEMAATIERAKADDPKELRRRIADLEKALKKQPLVEAKPETKIETIVDRVEVPVLLEKQIGDLLETIAQMKELKGELDAKALEIMVALDRVTQAQIAHPAIMPDHLSAVLDSKTVGVHSPAKQLTVSPPQRPVTPQKPADAPLTPTVSSGNTIILKGKQQAIIDAIAWWESIGVTPTGPQIGAVALIDATGGYFSNMVGPLVTGGYLVRSGGRFQLTESGKDLASPLQETPTMEAYHDMLRAKVRGMKSTNGKTVAILDVMIEAYGDCRTVQEIGQAVNIDHTGGYFSNSIGPLSTLRLITREAGRVCPTELLFPKGLS